MYIYGADTIALKHLTPETSTKKNMNKRKNNLNETEWASAISCGSWW